MRPALAALGGLAAAPGWLVGVPLGGLAGWLVERLGGLVGLAGLAAPLAALVPLVLAPALALGVYMLLAHGEDAPYFAGLAGVVGGAVLGEALALLGRVPAPPWASAAAAAVVLGALAGAAGEAWARAGSARPSPAPSRTEPPR